MRGKLGNFDANPAREFLAASIGMLRGSHAENLDLGGAGLCGDGTWGPAVVRTGRGHGWRLVPSALEHDGAGTVLPTTQPGVESSSAIPPGHKNFTAPVRESAREGAHCVAGVFLVAGGICPSRGGRCICFRAARPDSSLGVARE